MSEPREWWIDPYKTGVHIDSDELVHVIEKTPHVSKCVNMHETFLDFLADRIATEECHCDPTDNFECNKHWAERLLAKADE